MKYDLKYHNSERYLSRVIEIMIVIGICINIFDVLSDSLWERISVVNMITIALVGIVHTLKILFCSSVQSVCKKCHSKVDAEDNYCGQCGNQLKKC